VFARKTVEQLNAEMPLGDVMFNYDQSTIRDDQRAALQRNADYLRRWTTVRVSVEGHADARGTNEYNLALGERRANAVKEYLVGLGVTGDRMVVVSKGEETPLCTDMTEACYERNRRGHFVITAKSRPSSWGPALAGPRDIGPAKAGHYAVLPQSLRQRRGDLRHR
jgi:peptidoglycan-associated lipoprotein